MHDKLVEDFCEIFKQIHNNIIENSPDEHDFKGVRDEGSLYHTVHEIITKQRKGINPISLAAFCYLSFATRHVFYEGNKRMAHMVAQIILLDYGIIINVNYKEAKDFILKIARGEKKLKEIEQWIYEHSIKLEGKN